MTAVAKALTIQSRILRHLCDSIANYEALQKWFFFFSFLGLYLWHMEVSTLGVELELQLPTYTTTIATLDELHLQLVLQLEAMLDP